MMFPPVSLGRRAEPAAPRQYEAWAAMARRGFRRSDHPAQDTQKSPSAAPSAAVWPDDARQARLYGESRELHNALEAGEAKFVEFHGPFQREQGALYQAEDAKTSSFRVKSRM
jgi:hypothetical protein